MRRRKVVYAPEAEDDLVAVFDWIAARVGVAVAGGYTERLQDFCDRLDFASERGTLREDIRPGLRVVGFERRVVIAFTVDELLVTLLRIFYGGRDWEVEFQP